MLSNFLLVLKSLWPLSTDSSTIYLPCIQENPHLWADLTALDEVLSANARKPSWAAESQCLFLRWEAVQLRGPERRAGQRRNGGKGVEVTGEARRAEKEDSCSNTISKSCLVGRLWSGLNDQWLRSCLTTHQRKERGWRRGWPFTLRFPAPIP